MNWFSDAKARWMGMLSVVLALGLGTVHLDAEAAKRLGGGKSTGMQREAVPQKSNPSTPAQPGAPAQANPAAAPASAAAAAPAAAAAKQRPGWLGPVAGLAAGLGLAALASHFGFGEELATLLMLGLLFVVVLAVVGFILRRRAAANAGAGRGGMAYAGAGAGGMASPWSGGGAAAEPASVTPQPAQQPLHTAYTAHGASQGGSLIGAALQPSAAASQSAWPAGFDAEGFARNAKVQFIRLQAAYDAGNLDDIREFTTPEMFAELRMDLAERGASSSHNDVTQLEAEVVDVVEEAHRYVVSVRFSGEMRDSQTREVEPFHELWHLTKPREGQSGWVLAGIQQLQ